MRAAIDVPPILVAERWPSLVPSLVACALLPTKTSAIDHVAMASTKRIVRRPGSTLSRNTVQATSAAFVNGTMTLNS